MSNMEITQARAEQFDKLENQACNILQEYLEGKRSGRRGYCNRPLRPQCHSRQPANHYSPRRAQICDGTRLGRPESARAICQSHAGGNQEASDMKYILMALIVRSFFFAG